MLQIALLGFGVVGSGTAEALTENRQHIAAYCGDEVNIKYILDLREFPEHPLGDRVVHDIHIILNDPEVTLVAEMMGGAHPAYDFTRAALEAGKSVVTSNKEVVATFGVELLELARERGVSYLFEASVGGGIPIIRPMQTDLASNEILAVSGILNGTTNYILTQMRDAGAEFSSALTEAQRLGYAEANPAADVEGLDAARKISILAALAFGRLPDPNRIPTVGITGITREHTAMAEAFSGSVKLIGHTKKLGDRVLAMVSPFLVPPSNPICHVDGVFNGILVDANILGRALFYGAGAGKLPTASAVVADIVDILSHRASVRHAPVWRHAAAEEMAGPESLEVRRCFLLAGCPKCAAKVKALFGTEECVMLPEGGRFAVIAPSMTEAKALALLQEAGFEPILSLPVLE